MTFPQGGVWQILRARSLDAIPADTRLPYTPVRLDDWPRSGYYSLSSSTTRRVTLVAAQAEVGAALLTDTELLLNHAAEHQVVVHREVTQSDIISPAWLVVTIYYWSFYLALAITRLLGSTLMFLLPDASRALAALAGSIGSISPGAVEIECGTLISATDRNVQLTKMSGRIHDLIWKHLHQVCQSALVASGVSGSGTDEDRLYSALDVSFRRLGEDWPSAFRNAVNYSAGYAYSAVEGTSRLGTMRQLRDPGSVENVVFRFESSLGSLPRSPAPTLLGRSNSICNLLSDLVVLLHAFALTLHEDLVDRHALDRRAALKRRQYAVRMGLRDSASGGIWPMNVL